MATLGIRHFPPAKGTTTLFNLSSPTFPSYLVLILLRFTSAGVDDVAISVCCCYFSMLLLFLMLLKLWLGNFVYLLGLR